MRGMTGKEAVEQNAEALQRLIDETLLQAPSSVLNPGSIFEELQRRARTRRLQWDHTVVLEHWWWLARLGAIAFSGESAPPQTDVPQVLLTRRGRQLLERGEQSPHNPQRYYRAIEQRIGAPDSVVMTYLNEAVGGWAAGLYRASAVMLACACERLILILAQAVSETNILPWSGKLTKKFQQSTRSPVSISDIFEDVRDALLHLAGEKALPGKLSDALDRKLTPIFELARGLRNRAGHPTAEEVTSEEAEGNLLLFPSFYFLVANLIEHCRSKKAETT